MNSKDLANEICQSLFALTYRSSSSIHEFPIISRDQHSIVANTVLAILNDKFVQETAKYESKIFIYEEIIKKSNFAPMVEKGVAE